MTASRARVRRVPVRPVQERYLKSLDPDRGFKTEKPKSLRRLQFIQRVSVGVTLLLTGCVFSLYGWTIQSQKQWDQQYSKLEYLKQMEGKLINAAEALDHERVQSAWVGDNALTRETPSKTLFLEEMPPRPPIPPQESKKVAVPQLPIAY